MRSQLQVLDVFPTKVKELWKRYLAYFMIEITNFKNNKDKCSSHEVFVNYCNSYYRYMAVTGAKLRNHTEESLLAVVTKLVEEKTKLNKEMKEMSIVEKVRQSYGEKVDVPLEFVKVFTKVMEFL